MSKILILSMLLLVEQGLRAQVNQGTIIYERKINMHRRMLDEAEKAMVPEFNTSKVQLFFSGDESTFKNLPEEEDVRDNAGDDNGNRIVIRMGGPDNETYRNYATSKSIELRELGPQKYIIEDSIKNQHWKLEEGSKTVLGYDCKKAVGKSRDGKEVIAWYSESIRSSAGPEQFGGLPGVILLLDINAAEVVFTTIDLSTKDFNKKWVSAPTGGKKISSKEFEKMVKDEFGANPGGGPVIRIDRQER